MYCTEQNKYSFKRLKTHRFAYKENEEIVKLIDHQVFQLDWHMNDFLVFWDQEITLQPNH